MQQACETAVSMLRAAEAHEAPQRFRAIAMQVLQVLQELRYVGEKPAPHGSAARALVLQGGLSCLQQVPVARRTGAMCELDFWEGRLLAETPVSDFFLLETFLTCPDSPPLPSFVRLNLYAR
jgi:hypothetical protein